MDLATWTDFAERQRSAAENHEKATEEAQTGRYCFAMLAELEAVCLSKCFQKGFAAWQQGDLASSCGKTSVPFAATCRIIPQKAFSRMTVVAGTGVRPPCCHVPLSLGARYRPNGLAITP